MSNPFPAIDLSLSVIGSSLGLSAPYRMRDLSGKKVYLADGTRLFVTYPTNLNFNFFRGKYSTPPAIGPIFQVITSDNNNIEYPTGYSRDPTRIGVDVKGGGGGGGGKSDAQDGHLRNYPPDNGGPLIYNGISYGAGGGGGNGGPGPFNYGNRGNDGTNGVIIITWYFDY
jgi:hypothetical protein